MEEKTLQDYLNVPISEFRDVLNGKQENDFGVDIVSIRIASDGDKLMYRNISAATARESIPCINTGEIAINGSVIPVSKKMVSKKIVKMWRQGKSKDEIKAKWSQILSDNGIEIIKDDGKRKYEYKL